MLTNYDNIKTVFSTQSWQEHASLTVNDITLKESVTHTLDLSVIMLMLSFIIKYHIPAVLVIICMLCAVY